LTALPLPAGTARQPGECVQPVLLRGRVDQIDGTTGELLHRYSTIHEPGGVLPVACKTRRASRCPPCAEVYSADTYQLIRAGLAGGKGVPESVAALGFWPECFRRLNVKGGRGPFPEETRSAVDIEGKHGTIQGPSPDLSPAGLMHLPL
jgi:hypothetical protein